MKIIHLCLANFFIDDFSYQENLLPIYHQKIGHKIKIIASYQSFDSKGRLIIKDYSNRRQYFTNEGIEVNRVAYKQTKFNFLNIFFRKFRIYENWKFLLEEFQPDIIFIHGCQFVDIKLVKKFVQLYPQTTIYVDNHADYINSARNWLSLNILHRIIWRHFAKSIEPYTKKFWGVTPLRSLFLKEIYKIDKRKIDTLVMGVDIDSSEFDRKLEIRGEIRRSLGLNETNKVIINGGKLDVLKGTLILLESFIKITDPSYRLLLFGSISNEIANEISYFLKKDKRIIYLGWIEAKSIYKFLYASDVAVYPGTHSVLWEQTIGLGIPTIIKKWNGFEHLEINDSVRVLKKITVDLVLSCIIDFFENLEYFKKLGLENVNVFSYREIAKKSIEINKL